MLGIRSTLRKKCGPTGRMHQDAVMDQGTTRWRPVTSDRRTPVRLTGGKQSTSKPSLMISPHRERDEPSYAASVERVISKEEMPEVTRFFGIVVRMYFNDHSPAHFHAEYGEYEALFEIETLSILRGYLPRRAMALVLEWAVLHRQALRADWERARSGTPLESIAPLE